MGLLTNIFQTDLIQGLTLTIRYFFSKPVTLRYPEVRWEPPPRYRGAQVLKRHPDGKERCVGCGLCAEICPSSAIIIRTSEGEEHEKLIDFYQINLGLCIYCGFCQEVCPEDAVWMGNDYELSVTDPFNLNVTKESMLTKGDDPRYEDL
ncbi:MAG: NADH-quinone oxidoreductase subunit I [Deltaproteobacteria bacterium]|nr:NADH-quinone oxidoreductase subunit I [Deltaproteobacteria bacterium]